MKVITNYVGLPSTSKETKVLAPLMYPELQTHPCVSCSIILTSKAYNYMYSDTENSTCTTYLEVEEGKNLIHYEKVCAHNTWSNQKLNPCSI